MPFVSAVRIQPGIYHTSPAQADTHGSNAAHNPNVIFFICPNVSTSRDCRQFSFATDAAKTTRAARFTTELNTSPISRSLCVFLFHRPEQPKADTEQEHEHNRRHARNRIPD